MKAELLFLPSSPGHDCTVLSLPGPFSHGLGHGSGGASGVAPRHGQRRGSCTGHRCSRPAGAAWFTIVPVPGGGRRWRTSPLLSPCHAVGTPSALVVQHVVERSRCSVSATPMCGAGCHRGSQRTGHRARAVCSLASISCTCRLPLPAAQQGVEADAAPALLALWACLRAQSCCALALQLIRRAA